MKTETIDVRSWDDLVFINRNKAYGAYSVRKSYSRSMITGLGISVSVACLLLVTPKIIAQFQNDLPPEKPTTEVLTPIELKQVPEIEKPQPPQVAPPPPPPAAQIQTPIANLPPTPVTEEVDTEIPTNEEINNSQPTVDPNANGNGPVVDLPPGPPADPTDYNKEFVVVEIPPAFEGGQQGLIKFINKNTRYPSADRRLGTQGTVYVSFVVDKDGNVRDVKVARGISATCDKEAMRVISMMKGWSPGVQNKHNVAVRMTLPIRFQLAQE